MTLVGMYMPDLVVIASDLPAKCAWVISRNKMLTSVLVLAKAVLIFPNLVPLKSPGRSGFNGLGPA